MVVRSSISRRKFLKQGSVGVAALGVSSLAACSHNSAQTALMTQRKIGANERMNFAVIGVGGMGLWHVVDLVNKKKAGEKIEVPVVCDVYARRANKAASVSGAQIYSDYRRVLDDKNIDCVVVATPDHWHFKMAMETIEAGKYLYLQKPMVHTIEQALTLRDKVRSMKAIVQVGTQHTAMWKYYSAKKAIQDGLIGKVLWSQASFSRNSIKGEWNYAIAEDAGPHAAGAGHVDWGMWLGHKFGCAPKVPWSPEHFFRFRKYWAYSGGIATDLFYHKLSPMVLAINGQNGAYPKRVSSGGGIYIQKDGREVPDTSLVTIDYPSEHTVVLSASMANDDMPVEKIRGHHGTIVMGRPPVAMAQNALKEKFQEKSGGEGEMKLPKPEGWKPRRADHMLNFIDAIRGRDRLNCNIELGTAIQVAITMSVMAYRQQKTLLWDPVKEKVRTA